MVEARSASLGRWLRRGAKLLLLGLFLASVLLTILGLGASLDWPFAGAGIVLIVACALPALLQTFDMLWPNVGVGQYRAFFYRVEDHIVQRYRRRRLRAVFEVYGCERIALELLPDEAKHYSVSRRRAARRRRLNIVAVATALALASSFGTWQWLGRDVHRSEIGESFQLGDSWTLSVESRPSCGMISDPISRPGCTVLVRVTNTSQVSLSIAPGSFSFLDPDGDWEFVSGWYFVSLLAGSYSYRPIATSQYDGGDVYPGDSKRLTLTFDVPPGAQLTEIRFAAAFSSYQTAVRF